MSRILDVIRYGTDEEAFERALRIADSAYQRWLESPFVKRWLEINAEAQEATLAAAQARVVAAANSLRSSTLILATADLALTAGVPLSIWVGVYVALGAPYVQAQTLVRNENFVSGFTQGFVTGLLKWQWAHTKARFVRFSPDFNTSGAVDLGFNSANARNEGLRNGYIHASILPDDVKKKILAHLKSLSPSTHAGSWSRNEQISYVIELAAAGRRSRFFK